MESTRGLLRRLGVLAVMAVVVLIAALPPPAAAFSTNGECLGLLVQTATIELRSGFWAEGTHSISVRYVDPMFEVDVATDPVEFIVDEGASVYPGQVRVDQDGLFRGYVDVPGQTINPGQDTVLWAGWFVDMTGEVFGGPPTSMKDLKLDAAQAWIAFSVDGGGWVRGDMSPFHSVCANGALGGTNDVPLFHRTWGPSR